MRRATRNGVLAVAAASGAMAAVTMPAFADSSAAGTAVGSPGVASGNGVQLPVHLPVNLCGNTVNLVGLLNPAFGNSCANKGAAPKHAPASGAGATSTTAGSPGAVSGNGLQTPVDLPLNASGNSVDVVGVLNPVFGNQSVNGPVDKPRHPAQPSRPSTPVPPTRQPSAPEPEPQRPAPGPKTVPHSRAPQTPASHRTVSSLAHTGADATVPALAGSAALVLAGAVLYRRFRPGAQG
ncbi:chaplin family protein [Streptomyces sp. DSM 15324]|uniref:chaplin family protein n=1 Tax=Streptomyces sp. DSM 15324 TaxID=1739111 RepID=UPI0018FE4770|nr:chaplin family protein [Streptomyces sp. DSM 15324]